MMMGKVPPQDLEVEKAVLGVVLDDRFKQADVFEIIQSHEVFYADAHQLIYKCMLELNRIGMVIDLLTVTNHLRSLDQLDRIGGAYYLAEIQTGVMSSAHVEAHSRLLIEKYMARQLIAVGGAILTSGYNDTADVFDSMDVAEQQLEDMKNKIIVHPYRHVSKSVMDLQREIAEQKASNVTLTGINTGFQPLNDITGGWKGGNLYIIAARPGVGKTSLALNIALYCARDSKSGGPVGIFSLEMSEAELNKRFAAALSGVWLDRIDKPKLMTETDDARFTAAMEYLARLPIYLDDTAGLTMSQLAAKARRMVQKDGVKLIIVDYLQLMESDKESNNRERDIATISRGLKKLSKRLGIPIIPLSQMTRESERDDKAPELSHLRESGAIEQDASVVMFLWRPNKEKVKEKPHYAGKILGMIKKNRHGKNNQELVFHVDEDIQRWTDEEPSKLSGPNADLFKLETYDDLPF